MGEGGIICAPSALNGIPTFEIKNEDDYDQ